VVEITPQGDIAPIPAPLEDIQGIAGRKGDFPVFVKQHLFSLVFEGTDPPAYLMSSLEEAVGNDTGAELSDMGFQREGLAYRYQPDV